MVMYKIDRGGGSKNRSSRTDTKKSEQRSLFYLFIFSKDLIPLFTF